MESSYHLKIERAKKHISDANIFIQEHKPFRYTFEADYQSGKRSIGAKRDESAIGALALIVGDAIHNLRTALDHRTWELVSPHCTEVEQRAVQFPIANSFQTLDSTFENRKINRATKNVIDAFKSLNPYRGGDDNLVLIHDLDIIDKHKLLIPSANYTSFNFNFIRSIVPTFPSCFAGNITVIAGGRDVMWTGPIMTDAELLFHPRKMEMELPVPVQIVMREAAKATYPLLIPTLLNLTHATEKAITELAGL